MSHWWALLGSSLFCASGSPVSSFVHYISIYSDHELFAQVQGWTLSWTSCLFFSMSLMDIRLFLLSWRCWKSIFSHLFVDSSILALWIWLEKIRKKPNRKNVISHFDGDGRGPEPPWREERMNRKRCQDQAEIEEDDLEEEGRWKLFCPIDKETNNVARVVQVLEFKYQLCPFLAVLLTCGNWCSPCSSLLLQLFPTSLRKYQQAHFLVTHLTWPLSPSCWYLWTSWPLFLSHQPLWHQLFIPSPAIILQFFNSHMKMYLVFPVPWTSYFQRPLSSFYFSCPFSWPHPIPRELENSVIWLWLHSSLLAYYSIN